MLFSAARYQLMFNLPATVDVQNKLLLTPCASWKPTAALTPSCHAVVSFPSLIHAGVKARSLKTCLSGRVRAGSHLQVTASSLIFSSPTAEVSLYPLKMLSFSPRIVAVRKLCLNFSISLNFQLLHLQQMSQQSWVQLCTAQ